jgi:hypothetical protein
LYKDSMLSVWARGTLIRGADMLFVSDGDASCGLAVDIGRIEQEIAAQRRSPECGGADGGDPVVFTSLGVVEALMGPLTMAFNEALCTRSVAVGGCLGKIPLKDLDIR